MPYQRPYVNNADRVGNGLRSKGKPETRHHPACSSRVEKDSENITVQLFDSLHQAFHRVFGNGLIQENLAQLININGEVLSERYKKDLHELIAMNDNYVYKDGIRVKR